MTDKQPSKNSSDLADMFFKRLKGMDHEQARTFLATTFDIMVNKSIDETVRRVRDTMIDRTIKMEEALKPFADCCFNDNRMFTVSRNQVVEDDFIRAYDALQKSAMIS